MNNATRNVEETSTTQSSAAPAFKQPFKMYWHHHLSSLMVSCGRLMRKPLTTFMTLMVIGIALALPASLFVLLQNTKAISSTWQNDTQISLYLKSTVSATQTQALLNRLQAQSDIAQVKYISPAEGLAEMQQQSNWQNVLSNLNNNPLPAVILVQPAANLKDPAALAALAQKLQSLSEVDIAQLDMQWVQRLNALLALAKHLVIALAFLLGAGVLFIIGNTIHLNLEKYRREIEIFKLVGATNGFIRRPFLYMGILYGFFGAILAWLLTQGFIVSLLIPVRTLTNLYNSNFHLHGLGFFSTLNLLLCGIALGLIGAWLAIGKHLRAI